MQNKLDRDALKADLDGGVFITMKALADWHKEDGDEITAAGYRYLAEKRKFPGFVSDEFYWAFFMVRLHSKRINYLPAGCREYFQNTHYIRFAKLSEALEAAAKAIGQFLSMQELKEERRRQ